MAPNSPQRHIVIVGGGIIGASTAFYLTRHPAFSHTLTKIYLIEPVSIAAAASGKSGGFLARDWHGPATASLARLSFDEHRRLADEFGGADKWGYRPVEASLFLFSPSGAIGLAFCSFALPPSRRQTIQVTCDTSAPRPKRVPGLDWLDASIVRAASKLGSPEDTAQVTPGLLTEFLFDYARREGGVELVVGSAEALVRSSDETGRRSLKAVKVKRSQEDRGDGDVVEVPATDVVLCAGPWTGALVSKLFGVPAPTRALEAASTIDGHRAHSVVVRPPRPLSAHCLFTSIRYDSKAGEPEIYCRPDGTAYICGCGDNAPLPKSASLVTPDRSKTQRLVEQAAVVSPTHLSPASGAKVETEQACYLPIGARGDPVIGRAYGKKKQQQAGGGGEKAMADVDGVWIAAGHSCWGITNGPGTGKVMAELLLDGEAKSADISALQP